MIAATANWATVTIATRSAVCPRTTAKPPNMMALIEHTTANTPDEESQKSLNSFLRQILRITAITVTAIIAMMIQLINDIFPPKVQ